LSHECGDSVAVPAVARQICDSTMKVEPELLVEDILRHTEPIAKATLLK
jgi:hypothetical protein